MQKDVCGHLGCNSKPYSRGVCLNHYQILKGNLCLVAECGRGVSAKGMCQAHYRRHQRGQDVEGVPIRAFGEHEECTVIYCSKPHQAKGLCSSHYNMSIKYSISKERIDELPQKCLFCSSQEDLTIDHDHSCCSGKTSCGLCIRRVLCRKCNVGIAMFGDDPDTYRNIANILEMNPNPRV